MKKDTDSKRNKRELLELYKNGDLNLALFEKPLAGFVKLELDKAVKLEKIIERYRDVMPVCNHLALDFLIASSLLLTKVVSLRAFTTEVTWFFTVAGLVFGCFSLILKFCSARISREINAGSDHIDEFMVAYDKFSWFIHEESGVSAPELRHKMIVCLPVYRIRGYVQNRITALWEAILICQGAGNEDDAERVRLKVRKIQEFCKVLNPAFDRIEAWGKYEMRARDAMAQKKATAEGREGTSTTGNE